MRTRKIAFRNTIMARWMAYRGDNPAWSLDDLIDQLLTQHFNEADAVRRSVEEQEWLRERREKKR